MTGKKLIDHRLSKLENLMNRLSCLTTLYEDRSREDAKTVRRQIDDAREEIFRQLDRSEVLLDEDSLLHTHCILYFFFIRPYYAEEKDHFNLLFNEKFSVQKAPEDLTLQEISDYVRDLRDTVKPWYYTFFPQEAVQALSAGEIECMERIGRLGVDALRPLITALFYERTVRRSVSPEDGLALLELIEQFIRRRVAYTDADSVRFQGYANALHTGEQDMKALLESFRSCNPRRDLKLDDPELFKSFVKEVVPRYYSMADDSMTVHLEPCSLEADVDRRWFVYDSDDGYEEWSAKVVWLYDHVSDDGHEYSISRILRKVWIAEETGQGVKELFPDLLRSVDSRLITYDFDEWAACADSLVERYGLWKDFHEKEVSQGLPF